MKSALWYLPLILLACSACEKADTLFEKGKAAYDFDDRAKAIGFYDQACQLNHAEACAELGYAYYGDEDVATTDFTKSLASFEKACGLGAGSGCTGAAGWWSLQSDDDLKLNLIIPFLERGCELNDALSCDDLGHNYIDGAGVEADAAHGRELVEKACSLGDENSCYRYGLLLRDAVGGWVDYEKARELFYTACHEHDLRDGCNDYGEMLLTGDGGETDYEGAISYFKMACEAELNYACTNVAIVYADETLGMSDDVLVVDYAIKGCDLGDAKGCDVASQGFELGLGRDVDQAEMQAYRQKACAIDAGYSYCTSDN